MEHTPCGSDFTLENITRAIYPKLDRCLIRDLRKLTFAPKHSYCHRFSDLAGGHAASCFL